MIKEQDDKFIPNYKWKGEIYDYPLIEISWRDYLNSPYPDGALRTQVVYFLSDVDLHIIVGVQNTAIITKHKWKEAAMQGIRVMEIEKHQIVKITHVYRGKKCEST